MSFLLVCPIHHRHLIPMGENTYECPLDKCNYQVLNNSDEENFKIQTRVSWDIEVPPDFQWGEPLEGVTYKKE